MQRLIEGFRRFRDNIYVPRRGDFERLASGQQPRYLLITCSDSRITPAQFTQLDPGEIFTIRNAGNIVPDHRAGYTGEAASIEYALNVLKVKVIVVCGHAHCGAMKGLLNPETLGTLPSVRGWLVHAEQTRRRVDEKHAQLPDAEMLDAAIRENVLVQMQQIRSHPSVQKALAEQRVSLHGMVYHFDLGDLFVYDEARDQFTSVLATTAPDGSGMAARTSPAPLTPA